ncbi:MAG: DUF4097 family beta strand repeat-containing protein [Rhodanobacteraceae bacterium]
MHNPRHILSYLLAFALLGGCATTMAKPDASYHRTIEQTENVTPTTRLSLENLVGHVEITQGGAKLQVHAVVVSGGGDAAQARALADTIKLSVKRDGDNLVMHVDYPVDAHERYQYIPTHPDKDQHDGITVLGIHFGSSISNTSLRYQDHQVRVYQGSDHGVPLHVDLQVQLPVGLQAQISNHVGSIHVQQINNSLSLKTDSGDISGSDLEGELAIDTGSGDSRISRQHGTLQMHTGSGDVTLKDIHGDTKVHTGSGDIDGSGLHGGMVSIHAGSGDISLASLEGSLKLETGSGDVTLSDLGATPGARISCGSGDIQLSGDLSGMHGFDMQTGSGDITLVTQQPPAVHLDISAGDIDAQWAGINHATSERRHFSGDIGSASATGRISTGSGDVTLKQ